jgi:hypothetical protein
MAGRERREREQDAGVAHGGLERAGTLGTGGAQARRHVGPLPVECRAVGRRLRRAGHLPWRRAGRIPGAPATPPGSSPGYALTGQR